MPDPSQKAAGAKPESRLSRFIVLPAFPLFVVYDTLFGHWTHTLIASWLLASWAVAIGGVYGIRLAERVRGPSRVPEGILSLGVLTFVSLVGYLLIRGILHRLAGGIAAGTGHFGFLLAAAVVLGTPTVLILKSSPPSAGTLLRLLPVGAITFLASAGWLARSLEEAVTAALFLGYAAALVGAVLAFRTAMPALTASSTAEMNYGPEPAARVEPGASEIRAGGEPDTSYPSPVIGSTLIGLGLYLGYRLLFGRFDLTLLASWAVSSITAGSAVSYEFYLRAVVLPRHRAVKPARDLLVVAVLAVVGVLILGYYLFGGPSDRNAHWIVVGVSGAVALFPGCTLFQFHGDTPVRASTSLAVGGTAFVGGVAGMIVSGRYPPLEPFALALCGAAGIAGAALYGRRFTVLTTRVEDQANGTGRRAANGQRERRQPGGRGSRAKHSRRG